jgi:uncharacterized membrane protein
MLGLLGSSFVNELYRLSLKGSVGLTALRTLDAFIAWLTWREYHEELLVTPLAVQRNSSIVAAMQPL